MLSSPTCAIRRCQRLMLSSRVGSVTSVMGSSGSCRVWGYDPTRSWLRCRALRPTRSDVEWVWSIGPARPDLLKLEIDPLDRISGISKLWADPLDDSAGSGSGSRYIVT